MAGGARKRAAVMAAHESLYIVSSPRFRAFASAPSLSRLRFRAFAFAPSLSRLRFRAFAFAPSLSLRAHSKQLVAVLDQMVQRSAAAADQGSGCGASPATGRGADTRADGRRSGDRQSGFQLGT